MWLLFRNDDLGWNPKAFARLLTLFARHDQRLNAAAIPQALNDEVLKESIPYSYQAAPYLQIVTHGFSHQNHELEGKKAEYGSTREYADVKRELELGRLTLAERFENYYPCFVPPWNRMNNAFLPLLPECGYKILSREEEVAAKSAVAPIPEFNVSLDLHTRKDSLRSSAKEIFRYLARRNEEGADFVGVMLHHDKMTEEDFSTLDDLLKELTKRNISSCFFSDLIPGSERRAERELGHV